MLRELYIKNFAIFAEERIRLAPGMSVFTGETGAGKSLVVGAIALVLGARASSEDVRSGADEAVVEAVFDVAARGPLIAYLKEHGYDSADATLVIRRIIPAAVLGVTAGGAASSRGRVFINGGSATVGDLARLGEHLIDLSGQHAQQVLLDETRHLGLLDSFARLQAKAAQAELASGYATQFSELRSLMEQQRELQQRKRTAAERADFLRYRVKELETLKLKAGEEEELRSKHQRMQHSIKLFDLTRQTLDTLSETDGALLEKLGGVRRQLERGLEYDAGLEARLKEIREAESQLTEASYQLNSYVESLNFDPAERDQVEERLFKLNEVARKYGSVQAAFEQQQAMQQELSSLENVDGDLTELERRLLRQRQDLTKLGLELRAMRQAAAGKLAKAVEKELAELAMEGARLEVRLTALATDQGEELTPGLYAAASGLDEVAFLFSANRGEELKPLVKVASGGELSRLLLAVKLVLTTNVPTMIFDEVDAGISGRQAEVVGRKMQRLSQQGQVFCVTHLAPIAAYGAQHYRVVKAPEKGRTVARAEILDKHGRTREVARLLAGETITPRTLAHAEEMLTQASP